MIKLINTDSFNPQIEAGAFIMTNTDALTKSASTIFECTYDDVKPPMGKVAVHLIALGDEEAYGANRNADGFPKKANQAYYHTFKTKAHVFEHHNNQDPKKKLGDIVKAAYNEPMSRVELIIHADEDKASKHLDRMEKEGSVPVSMACSVPNDRCSICGTLRKTTKDPNQCDHVRNSLGKMAEDGSLVFVHNDKPTFFDISFVGRPADRTAFGFKAASDNSEFISSTELAAREGIVLPDRVSFESEEAGLRRNLIHKLASFEKYYLKINKSIKTATDNYYYNISKASINNLDDNTIKELRKYSPEQVFSKLAKLNVILPLDSFYKYAFGVDYGDVSQYIGRVKDFVSTGLFNKLEKSASLSDLCNDNYFDYTRGIRDYYTTLPAGTMSKIAEALSFNPSMVPSRAISATAYGKNIKRVFIKCSDNTNNVVTQLAYKYASYKIAMLRSIMENSNDTSEDDIIALSVSQDLFN